MAEAAGTSGSEAASSANKALVDAQKKLRISQQQVTARCLGKQWIQLDPNGPNYPMLASRPPLQLTAGANHWG